MCKKHLEGFFTQGQGIFLKYNNWGLATKYCNFNQIFLKKKEENETYNIFLLFKIDLLIHIYYTFITCFVYLLLYNIFP